MVSNAAEQLDEDLSIVKGKASQSVEDVARIDASLDEEGNKVERLTCLEVRGKGISWRARGPGKH